MRWNHGVARCARLANSPFGDVLAYSKSPRLSVTAKLMSDGWRATPRRSSSRSKRG